jgi:hypothetical protein
VYDRILEGALRLFPFLAFAFYQAVPTQIDLAPLPPPR